MTTWFRFYDATLNDATVQRLPGEKFKLWVNLLCIASQQPDGVLPPVADLAFLLRPLVDDKVAALLAELAEKGLLEPAAGGRYAPYRWSQRQFKSDVTDATAPLRQQRYRERKKNARNGNGRDDRDAAVTTTRLEEEKEKYLEQSGVTAGGGLIHVTDEQALACWDDFGRKTRGKPYPRDRSDGWRFPSKFPPGHEAEVRPIGRQA
jgi:hypothetical protein